MNQKVATIGLGLLALVVVFVFLLLPGPPTPAPTPAPAKQTATPDAAPTSSYSADFGSEATQPAKTGRAPQAASTLPAGTTWEQRLDELLTADTGKAETVRSLVSSMRGLRRPRPNRNSLPMRSICAKTSNSACWRRSTKNSATPQKVSESIFIDALNRPDVIKLPLLAKTLRTQWPAKPKKSSRCTSNLNPAPCPPAAGNRP